MPQARVRFFLFAAKQGCKLPEFPKPVYLFEVNDSLQIKNGSNTLPFQPLKVPTATTQTALHTSNSVGDAISDLTHFDWYWPLSFYLCSSLRLHSRQHPGIKPQTPLLRETIRRREVEGVDVIDCSAETDEEHPPEYVGYKGSKEYGCAPKTAYQLSSRIARHSLQTSEGELHLRGKVRHHYTRRLAPSIVER